MSDTSSLPQQLVSANVPRHWIGSIVGGVLLGEALWAMLQILIRDWAAPAILNATGQGPTQNTAAFEPLPLVIAFIEACVAGIVLLLLMSWAQRRARVVTIAAVKSVAATTVAAATPASVVPAPVVPAMERRSEPRPVAVPAYAPTRVAASAPRVASSANTATTAPLAAIPETAAAPPTAPIAVEPLTVQPVATQPVVAQVAAAKPASPPTPKKPKTVYYNSVGEPIED
jgi:hypothetical protein